ncbi:MAG: hypothetical protein IJV16_04885, partial [Lachnospiraceae bacterium]|nr:hypothetical protein [Lachnospiraceae bacterium]
LPYLNIFPTVELSDEEREELSDAEAGFFIGSDAVSGNAISANAVSGNSVSENSISENEIYTPNVIQYDPGTGFPLDPNTGEILDPKTLLPIDENVKSDLEY